ncbi:DUF4282 domain-containing protein [Corynebacterium riegelii]|uniref:DUF4282 domain-containing protein n=1 Tax=Corynebacterium riegelii TaxID=156976 RepID=UPI00288BC740|nr:DUF4282 domain-containing protein [Corynebacterium riegelii]
MSNPYNPNGADDQNDKPDFTAEPTPETSSEQTTEFGSTSGSTSGSADSAASEWGTPSQSADSSQSQYGQGGYTPYGETQYGQGGSQGGYGQGGYGQSQYGDAQYGQGEHQQHDYSQQQYQAQGQAQQQGQFGQYGYQQQGQYGQGDFQQAQYGAGYPQGGYQQGYGPQGQYGVPSSNNGRKKPGDGFFQALFDFSFSRFITISFAKILYIILLAVTGLVWLFFLVAAIGEMRWDFASGFVGLLLVTLACLVSIVVWRVTIEFLVATVKTSQNTSKLVEFEQDKADKADSDA